MVDFRPIKATKSFITFASELIVSPFRIYSLSHSIRSPTQDDHTSPARNPTLLPLSSLCSFLRHCRSLGWNGALGPDFRDHSIQFELQPLANVILDVRRPFRFASFVFSTCLTDRLKLKHKMQHIAPPTCTVLPGMTSLLPPGLDFPGRPYGTTRYKFHFDTLLIGSGESCC